MCPFWVIHANVSLCCTRFLQWCFGASEKYMMGGFFYQFLWVVRCLNVWLLHCMVGVMLGNLDEVHTYVVIKQQALEGF